MALLERAQNVDLAAWACRLDKPDTIASRYMAASAHQMATCLYVMQSFPSLSRWVGDGAYEALIDRLYNTLSQIPDPDPNFKATIWPTFIIGTTAWTVERQNWVIDRLRRLTVAICWGFVYTAIDTLQALWRLDERVRRSRNWVHTLRDMGINCLVV